jgi:hypothetical protein
MDSSDWSNGIRQHIFDTRPDTEFNFNLRRYIEDSAKLDNADNADNVKLALSQYSDPDMTQPVAASKSEFDISVGRCRVTLDLGLGWRHRIRTDSV